MLIGTACSYYYLKLIYVGACVMFVGVGLHPEEVRHVCTIESLQIQCIDVIAVT